MILDGISMFGAFVLGGMLGWALCRLLSVDGQDAIVAELLRTARRVGYSDDEIRRISTVMDIQGERFHPLLRVFRRRGMTMERSTGLLDRFRLAFLPDGETLPEHVHGVLARDLETRGSDIRLDEATRLAGICQPALPEDNAGHEG